MYEFEIMEFIYDNTQNDELWVNLVDYFSVKFKNPTDSLYSHLRNTLMTLAKKELVNFADPYYKSLGRDIPAYPPQQPISEVTKLTFEEFDRRNKLRKELGEYFGIMAQLTLDGRKEIQQFKFSRQLKDVNQSVIDSTKFGKWVRNATIASAIFAGITTVFIGLQFAKDDSQGLRLLNKQLEKTSIILDSMLQSQKGIDSSLQKAVRDSFYASPPRQK
jgi:hypothetical protein